MRKKSQSAYVQKLVPTKICESFREGPCWEEWKISEPVYDKLHLENCPWTVIFLQESECMQCLYYWWGGFMKYPSEMDPAGILFLPNIMKISLGIQVILRSLVQQFEKVPWFGIDIKFLKIKSDVQTLFEGHTHTHTQSSVIS
jgi:hypothetical protein